MRAAGRRTALRCSPEFSIKPHKESAECGALCRLQKTAQSSNRPIYQYNRRNNLPRFHALLAPQDCRLFEAAVVVQLRVREPRRHSD
jgi:hypothetical protein